MSKTPTTASSGLATFLRTSEAAWSRNDFQQSIEILERAAKQFPNDPCVLLDLGRAHGLRFDYAAARLAFEKAIRVAGWKTEAFVAAGLHCRNFDNLTMAQDYFERALKKNENATEALVQLAEIHERFHRLDLAAEYVDRALRANCNLPSVLLARVRLDRQAGQLAEAEHLLRTFVSNPHPDVWTRVRAWYELGGILDRQQRFDEAMSAFVEAKTIQLRGAQPLIAAQQRNQAALKQTGEMISAEHFRRWFESGAELHPPRRYATIGGHPRSGTTLLEQVLDAHPDVISLEETTILDSEAFVPLTRGRRPDEPLVATLDSADAGGIRKSRAQFLKIAERFLGTQVGSRLLIDKSPARTSQIPAVIRIFPESKFIIALRDPRDVVLSCFMQPLPLNPVAATFLTLDGTVREYASMMNFWLTIRPRLSNPWIEVRYEDLVADLESVARRTLDFLEVPWDPRVLGFDEHARTKLVRSPTYADVVRPVFKSAIGRWRNYQKHIEPLLPALQPLIDAFGYD